MRAAGWQSRRFVNNFSRQKGFVAFATMHFNKNTLNSNKLKIGTPVAMSKTKTEVPYEINQRHCRTARRTGLRA
jgi:hypothetical protein